MKKAVSLYEIRTEQSDVTVSLPEKAELLGVHMTKWGAHIVALSPRDNSDWVDWHFRWHRGDWATDLLSENYVGSVVIGPSDEMMWHLFVVDN